LPIYKPFDGVEMSDDRNKIVETMARATHGYAFRLIAAIQNDSYGDRSKLPDLKNTCEQATLDATAALTALEAAGYRVVPVEPTEAMIEAGYNAYVDGLGIDWDTQEEEDFMPVRWAYAAMLESATAAPIRALHKADASS